jgi:chromosome segregation ATPase
MESEKVKEIKKALECCVDSIKYGCKGCPYHKSSSDCQELLIWDMQTYINELESENERWQEKEGALSCDLEIIREKLTNAEIEVDDYKDRIAELEEELTNDRIFYKDGICYPMNCQGALKQFAERLKEKLFDLGNIVKENDIDETLKEFLK